MVRVRREHADGKSIKAIAQDLRLSRKARKAIRAPEAGFAYQRLVQPLPRIGPYQERLDALWPENEARPRRDRLRMMMRIHDLLLREGFDGSYDAARRMGRAWVVERHRGAGDGAAAFIPLMFRPGETYQLDSSHQDVEIAVKPMRLVRSLHAGSFLPSRRNVLPVGGTGTGKTHPATGITASVLRARGRYSLPSTW